MGDNVDKPKHYILPDGTETLSVSRWLSSNGGQAIQYVVRATRTDGVVKENPAEDVRKAIRLLQDEAERFEFLEGKGQANPDAVHKVIGDLNEMAAAYARDTAMPPSVYPPSSPRVWYRSCDIPLGVKAKDTKGDVFRNDGVIVEVMELGKGCWWEYARYGATNAGQWEYADQKYGPFTEVVE